MTKIYNKGSEKPKRRILRNNPTLPEEILWLSLNKRQIHGFRFLRQYSINHFVVDFYCPKLKLAIELDGDSHEGKEVYDKIREEYIRSLKIKIIRFKNEQLMSNGNKVVEDIKRIVLELKSMQGKAV